MSDEMHACEWVTKEPIYIKKIGNMNIDPSEFENEKGAFLAYDEIPCRYVTDEGKKFCPRHELEAQLAEKPPNFKELLS